MLKAIKDRHNATGIIILFYLATVVLLSAIASRIAPPEKSWNILAYGILLASFGSIATLIILRSWEQNLKRNYYQHLPLRGQLKEEQPPPSVQEEPKEDRTSLLEGILAEKEKQLTDYQEKQHQLETLLEEKLESIKLMKQEDERLKEEVRSVTHKFTSYKEDADNDLQQKGVLSEEYQQTITDQRTVIKKKQRRIVQLEEKVHDLNYEIKTLLELNDSFKKSGPSDQNGMMVKEDSYTYTVDEEKSTTEVSEGNKQAHTVDKASTQLKRCLNIAQKITGAHHFSGTDSRFKDINMQNFQLDKRRLFDSLRSENSTTVLVYAPKDSKLLFVNNEVKTLLGWSPDKFTQNFHEVLQEGLQEWKRGVSSLSAEPEAQVRLLMKTFRGQDMLVHCLLGIIPTGLFRGHVIGILYAP